jgi:hypothetical protein
LPAFAIATFAIARLYDRPVTQPQKEAARVAADGI